MPVPTKLLCNKCFQPLDIVEYPEGLYVNPCHCMVAEYNDIMDKKCEKAYEEGYYEGSSDKESDMEHDMRHLENKIEKLEAKIEDDDNFSERMGII